MPARYNRASICVSEAVEAAFYAHLFEGLRLPITTKGGQNTPASGPHITGPVDRHGFLPSNKGMEIPPGPIVVHGNARKTCRDLRALVVKTDRVPTVSAESRQVWLDWLATLSPTARDQAEATLASERATAVQALPAYARGPAAAPAPAPMPAPRSSSSAPSARSQPRVSETPGATPGPSGVNNSQQRLDGRLEALVRGDSEDSRLIPLSSSRVNSAAPSHSSRATAARASVPSSAGRRSSSARVAAQPKLDYTVPGSDDGESEQEEEEEEEEYGEDESFHESEEGGALKEEDVEDQLASTGSNSRLASLEPQVLVNPIPVPLMRPSRSPTTSSIATPSVGISARALGKQRAVETPPAPTSERKSPQTTGSDELGHASSQDARSRTVSVASSGQRRVAPAVVMPFSSRHPSATVPGGTSPVIQEGRTSTSMSVEHENGVGPSKKRRASTELSSGRRRTSNAPEPFHGREAKLEHIVGPSPSLSLANSTPRLQEDDNLRRYFSTRPEGLRDELVDALIREEMRKAHLPRYKANAQKRSKVIELFFKKAGEELGEGVFQREMDLGDLEEALEDAQGYLESFDWS